MSCSALFGTHPVAQNVSPSPFHLLRVCLPLQPGIWSVDLFPLVSNRSREAFEAHVAAQLQRNVSITRVKTSGGEVAPPALLYLPDAFQFFMTPEEENTIKTDYLPALFVQYLCAVARRCIVATCCTSQ